jgi:hypothetical protein
MITNLTPYPKGWECDACGGQNFDEKGHCKFCLEKRKKEAEQ